MVSSKTQKLLPGWVKTINCVAETFPDWCLHFSISCFEQKLTDEFFQQGLCWRQQNGALTDSLRYPVSTLTFKWPIIPLKLFRTFFFSMTANLLTVFLDFFSQYYFQLAYLHLPKESSTIITYLFQERQWLPDARHQFWTPCWHSKLLLYQPLHPLQVHLSFLLSSSLTLQWFS